MASILLALAAGLISPVSANAGDSLYKSMYEAKYACDVWQLRGGYFNIRGDSELGRNSVRDCKLEKETSQFLGFEWTTVQEGRTYSPSEFTEFHFSSRKVVHYFRFRKPLND